MNLNKMFLRYKEHNLKGRYKFIDRRKNKKKLVLLLIGYKKKLWPDVLPRFKEQITDDMDVCLISSGRCFEELKLIANTNEWSYLSTKKNNVCLIQNIAINLFPNAELIYKIDEDIFLTDGTFKKMEETLYKAQEESPYNVGMVSPLLNLNAYGYYRILEKTGRLEEFEKRFGKAKMAAGQTSLIETNPDVAKFMWGEDGKVDKIDVLNKKFSEEPFNYSICPIRLSIGCVLYKRSFWEAFGRFPVVFGDGMGLDETIIIGAGAALSEVMAVAENSVVGHFGYGKQSAEMFKLYETRPELFSE